MSAALEPSADRVVHSGRGLQSQQRLRHKLAEPQRVLHVVQLRQDGPLPVQHFVPTADAGRMHARRRVFARRGVWWWEQRRPRRRRVRVFLFLQRDGVLRLLDELPRRRADAGSLPGLRRP